MGETAKKDMDADEILQSVIDDLKKMKTASTKQFKEAIIDIVEFLLQSNAAFQKKHDRELDQITAAWHDRLKAMDKVITRLRKNADNAEKLRYFTLFHAARLDHAFDKLVEMKLIEPWTEEMRLKIWDDDRIALLGFDCSAEELRQRFIDQAGVYENRDQGDQKEIMTGKK